MLGLDPRCTQSQVRGAYKSLILVWHPDKLDSTLPNSQEAQRINEAYAVLGDPTQRSLYDRELITQGTLLGRGEDRTDRGH